MTKQLPELPQGGKYMDMLTDWSFKRVCSGTSNKRNLIELLNDLLDGERHIRDRTIFSTSRIISNQYVQGDDYRNTALPEVYFIGILDFRMDTEEKKRYIRQVELTDRDTGKVLYPKLTYIFLELPNFVKTDTEIRTDMDQWFWLFKHLYKADRLPAFLKKRVFSRIFNIAEISNLSEAIS